MHVLHSQIQTGSAEFQANDRTMRALVAEMREREALVRRGAVPDPRVRDAVRALLAEIRADADGAVYQLARTDTGWVVEGVID